MSAPVQHAPQILASAPTGMAGPVALFIIVLLCVASYFLFRSMSRHLAKIPADFPADPEFPNPPAQEIDVEGRS